MIDSTHGGHYTIEAAALKDFRNCRWEPQDPRTSNASLHNFQEILMILLCSMRCGGQTAVGMALFAEAKEPFPARVPRA